MKTAIKLSDAIGKTLASFAFSENGQLVLVFSDYSFVTLGVAFSEVVEEELDVYGFGDKELIRVGIITAEEIDEMRSEWREHLNKKDYDLYLRLKWRFEKNEHS